MNLKTKVRFSNFEAKDTNPDKMASNRGLELELGELRGKIVCQICETPARPGKTKWYRCPNLHQICHDCKVGRGGQGDEVVDCSCKQPISKIHCKWTEEFLEKTNGLKVKLSCKNAKNGCEETFDENALDEHESECVFRLVPCMDSRLGCKEKVFFRNVIQHHEEKHAPLIPMENKSKRVASKVSNVKIDLNGKHFILLCTSNKNSLDHWVYLAGSPEEAKHFSYNLKFFGPNSTNDYTGKVGAVDESFQTLFDTGRVCVYNRQAFNNQFLNEDRKYEYSLEIRNLKEEVKDENVDSGASDIEDSNE